MGIVKRYKELTLANWKKWDLVKYIKQQEQLIDDIARQIRNMYYFQPETKEEVEAHCEKILKLINGDSNEK